MPRVCVLQGAVLVLQVDAMPQSLMAVVEFEGKEWENLEKAADCRKLSVREEANLGTACSYKPPLKRPLVETRCVELCAWGII